MANNGAVDQEAKERREYRTKTLMVTGLPKCNQPTVEWLRQQFQGTRVLEEAKIKEGGITQFQTRNGSSMTQVEVESEEVATAVLRKKYSLRQAPAKFKRVHIFPHRPKDMREASRRGYGGQGPPMVYGAQGPPRFPLQDRMIEGPPRPQGPNRRGYGPQGPPRYQQDHLNGGWGWGWRGNRTWPPRPEGRWW
jgi:hypothetical protein